MSQNEIAYHGERQTFLSVEAKVRRGDTTLEYPRWWHGCWTCAAWHELTPSERDRLALARQAPSHFPDDLA